MRTRNSATANTCINIGLSTTDAYLTSYVPQGQCAEGLVELSERNYPDELMTVDMPYADQPLPGFQNLGYFHGFGDFDIAFEARDADNNPVEYVRAKGNGADPNSVVYARSTVSQISLDDSCLKPSESGGVGFTSDCDNEGQNFKYLISLIRGEDSTYRASYMRTTEDFAFSPTVLSENFRYFSVVALENDTVHSKLVITRRGDEDSLSVKAYRYAVPTTTEQSTTDTSTTTSTTSDETATTEVTTPISTDAPDTTVVTQKSAQELCSDVDGVEVFPGLDSWKDSTKFEITVSNDCTRAIAKGELQGVQASHGLTAINKEDGRKVWYPSTTNDKQQILFTGRLYAGTWEFTLHQFIYGEAITESFDSYATISVNVASDTANPLTVCTSSDITWDGSVLELNCSYSQVQPNYIANNNQPSAAVFLPEQQIELQNLTPGWQPVSLSIDQNGFNSVLNLVLCSTDCTDLPSAVAATVIRNSNAVTISSKSDACSWQELPFLGVHYLKKINNNLMVHMPRTVNAFIDLITQADTTTTLDMSKEVDHLLVFRDVDPDNKDCRKVANHFNMQWSIIPIPEEVTNSADTPEPSAAKSPAVIEKIEFSRVNSVGAPVVISSEQSVIEIPSFALPDSVFSSEENPVVVSVRSGGSTWTPVSKSIATLIAIADGATNVEVKYSFADGSEAIVTKPIQNAAEYEQKVAESSSSSSNTLLFVLLGLGFLVVAGGATVILRRKN